MFRESDLLPYTGIILLSKVAQGVSFLGEGMATDSSYLK